MVSRRILVFIAILGLGSIAIAAPGQTPKQSPNTAKQSDVWDNKRLLEPTYAGVKVVASANIKVSAPNHGYLNMGEISALDGAVVKAEFSIINSRTSRILLKRITASCGCTSASVVLPGVNGRHFDTTTPFALPIEPRGSVSVAVTLSPGDMDAGSFKKAVYLYIDGIASPAIIVDMVGSVRPSVSFSPQFIDFGTVSAIETKSVSFTATLDSRLLRRGMNIEFAPPSPGISISRAPSSVSSTIGTPLPQSGTNQIRYVVTIGKNPPLGPLHVRAVFAEPEKYDDQLKRALSRTALLIVGNVKGSISASPPVITMGTISSARAALRTVTLYAESSDALKMVNADSDNVRVSCHLGASGIHTIHDDGHPEFSVCEELEITVAPGAPVGALVAHVKLAAGNGQVIYMPVYADVQQ